MGSCWCSTCRVRLLGSARQPAYTETCGHAGVKHVCVHTGVGEILTDPSVIKSGEKG